MWKRNIIFEMILLSLLLVIFNLSFFLSPIRLDSPTNWIAYFFGMFGFILSSFVFYFVQSRMKNNFYLVQLLYGNTIFFCLELFLAVLLLVVNHFFSIEVWISTLVESLVLLSYIIYFFVFFSYSERIKETKNNYEKNIKFMEGMRYSLKKIQIEYSESSLSKELGNLCEFCQFSEPTSSEFTKDIDTKILEEEKKLQTNLAIGNMEEARLNINKLMILFKERREIHDGSI